MYSPMSQQSISPFISLKTSIAQIAPNTHVRTLSNHKPTSSTPQSVQQFTKTPSQKKLTLTTQMNPTKHQIRIGQQQMKKRNIVEYQSKGRFDTLRIQSIVPNQQPRQSNQILSISQQSLMMLFQQKMENLKHQYILSLKDYEHRIDYLQNQLQKNQANIQVKNEQIKHLQLLILEMKANYVMKSQQSNKHIQLRMQDIEKKISILSSYSQHSHQQIQQNCDNLTQNLIKFIGSKLNNIKNIHSQYIQSTSLKLLDIEHRLSKDKNNQSQGTRGSMQSVGDTACFQKPAENGVSFWDDCFFYPTEKSENCLLIIQMANRRNQAVCCWIDYEGFLHYCDSGSFLFNMKGERVHLENEEVKWLESENLLKLY